MARFCCEMMQSNVEHRCGEHPNPFECPDNLISYSVKREEYGVIVHDGGSSQISIAFCPWCGARLASPGALASGPTTFGELRSRLAEWRQFGDPDGDYDFLGMIELLRACVVNLRRFSIDSDWSDEALSVFEPEERDFVRALVARFGDRP
jgi:hypothetical protein